ncbi:MAG: alpha-amylase [Saccharofermentanales bacterium]|jgi:alpha-amylase
MKNGLAIQYFEWYLPNDGKLWQRIREDIPQLREMGVTAVWIPPCYKGQSSNDVGYGAYDLYDLGEFNQKGTVRTKYGTLGELQETIAALHDNGIQVYADTVLNHKAGADQTEIFRIVEVDPEERETEISEPYDIEGWTRFFFSGRAGKYSQFEWYHQHFTAVDFDQRTGNKGIFKILGEIQGESKDFSENVTEEEKGNYDYLMHADVDYNNPDVIEEIKRWGSWFIKKLNLDGLRLDALKHIDLEFINDWTNHVREESGRELYVVGEYWNGDYDVLREVLDKVGEKLALFDVPLHFRFFDAAKQGKTYDLSKIFEKTLVNDDPDHVMTFVDNHDSQLGQSLESWVDDWFKPLAYALILLRKNGYPCLFYGDYFGCGGETPVESKKAMLDPLLRARKYYAYGEQIDYFDHPNCIAFQRMGEADNPDSGLLCIMSNGEAGYKDITFSQEFAARVFYDITGNREEMITLDKQGQGRFFCDGGSVSVWVLQPQKE